MENDRNTFKNLLVVPSQISVCPRWYSAAAKRLVDLLAAVLGLLLLSPLFAFIALLIRRDSPGPVFFRGPRSI
jgi:lipopolysaccharide/colanic/teichoic acid biosynthesis glycosyltransferase